MAASYLADWGAEVIRVESYPRAETLRPLRPTPGGLGFADNEPMHPLPWERHARRFIANHSKQGIALNVRDPRGYAIVQRLIAIGDVLIENYSSGTIARLGLAYETVRKLNPRIIMASISGWGDSGPYAGYSAMGAYVDTTTGNATLTGSNYNSVAWTAVSGATSYNVYGRPVTSGGSYFLLGNVASSPYLDQNNVAGTVPPLAVGTAGISIASVNDCTISGSMPMKQDRYYLGATGLKAEPIMNDYPTVTGKLSADFVSQADFYDRFAADSAAVLQLTFLGQTIQAPYVETLIITVPEVHFTGDTPQLGGLDIIQLAANFEAAFDGTNPGCQFEYISPDTAI